MIFKKMFLKKSLCPEKILEKAVDREDSGKETYYYKARIIQTQLNIDQKVGPKYNNYLIPESELKLINE